ncbi:MAG: hypothetical protein HC854_02565 [Flavobacterium sp.]|nr:hypothetical protein [Flavobacterium sp.]
MPSDYCKKIVCDDNGFLWIGTLNGLVKFNPVSKKVMTVLTRQHGLNESPIDVPINLLPNGKLVINFYTNLSIFNINKYQFNKVKPNVIFTTIKVLNEELLATYFSKMN